MYNKKTKSPFVFVNFRKVISTGNIIGLFIHTYDSLQDDIVIFDTDHLSGASKSFILEETEKISRVECNGVYQMILNQYHLYHNDIECEIRCSPALPKQWNNV